MSKQQTRDICPRCGKEGDSDPDGFYCPHCNTYFDLGDYRERWAELMDDSPYPYAEEIDDGDGDPLMQCEDDFE